MIVDGVVVERVASAFLPWIGGAAGGLIISTLFGVWGAWRQVGELERQTELELVQAEFMSLILKELRKK